MDLSSMPLKVENSWSRVQLPPNLIFFHLIFSIIFQLLYYIFSADYPNGVYMRKGAVGGYEVRQIKSNQISNLIQPNIKSNIHKLLFFYLISSFHSILNLTHKISWCNWLIEWFFYLIFVCNLVKLCVCLFIFCFFVY